VRRCLLDGNKFSETGKNMKHIFKPKTIAGPITFSADEREQMQARIAREQKRMRRTMKRLQDDHDPDLAHHMQEPTITQCDRCVNQFSRLYGLCPIYAELRDALEDISRQFTVARELSCEFEDNPWLNACKFSCDFFEDQP
jgi:hypothetical protein